MRAEGQKNPYPGLRPFERADSGHFFGRDRYAAELLNLLRSHRFVSVVGASGSGKSSLVKAGVLPLLKGGMLDGSTDAWVIAEMKPGNAPISALASSLVKNWFPVSEPDDQPGERDKINRAEVESYLRSGSRSLLNVAEEMLSGWQPGTRLLLLVDQFEELFRFRGSEVDTRNEAAAFARMLLDTAEQAEVPIFVIITMRLDFLKNCTVFRGLTEALNRGQYLVPPMTREECREAIIRPALQYGKKIQPILVETLLNEADEGPDQLPILQHALMRSWDRAGDAVEVGLAQYDEIGRVKGALSQHADDIYGGLVDDDTRVTAKEVFKALSTRGKEGQALRRPRRLSNLSNLVGGGAAAEHRVRAVVDNFSKPGNNLIVCRAAEDEDAVVDISHEALLRIWERLRQWMKQERRDEEKWERVVSRSQDFKTDETNILKGSVLNDAETWLDSGRLTSPWVELVDKVAAGEAKDRVALAERLIQTSRKVRETSRKVRETDKKRKRRNWVLGIGGPVLLAIGIVSFFLISQHQDVEAERVRTAALMDYVEAIEQIAVLRAQGVFPAGETLDTEIILRLERALSGAQLESHVRPVLIEQYYNRANVYWIDGEDGSDENSNLAEILRRIRSLTLEADPSEKSLDRHNRLRDAQRLQLGSVASRGHRDVLGVGQTYLFEASEDGSEEFEIQLPEGSEAFWLVISTDLLGSSTDSFLTLSDATTVAGLALIWDDDGGVGLGSELIHYVQEGDALRLIVRNLGDAGSFRLDLTARATDGPNISIDDMLDYAATTFARGETERAEIAFSIAQEHVTIELEKSSAASALLSEGSVGYSDAVQSHEAAIERLLFVNTLIDRVAVATVLADGDTDGEFELEVGGTYTFSAGSNRTIRYRLAPYNGPVVATTYLTGSIVDSVLGLFEVGETRVPLARDDDGARNGWESRLEFDLADEPRVLAIGNIGGPGIITLELTAGE